MIIVIPLHVTQQLMALARSHQLNLPIPLSSACASYLSQEEMDTILEMLTPLHDQNLGTAALIHELQRHREQHHPVIPCAQA